MSLIGIALGAACATLWVYLIRRPEPLRQWPPAVPQGDLSQVAWALGGPWRTVNAWWASLRAAGILVEQGSAASRQTQSWGIGKAPLSAPDPWLIRAAQAVPTGGGTSLEVLGTWVSLLEEVKAQMLIAGLLAQPGYRRRRMAMHVVLAFTTVALTAKVGVSGTLGSALLASAFLALCGLGVLGIPRLSAWGLQCQRRWADEHAAAARAPEAGSVGWAVAVGGLAVLGGTPFAAWALAPVSGASGSGSGCGSASVGGGCGSATAAASGAFGTGGGFGGGDSNSGGSDGGGGCGGGGCGGGGCGG